jgi:hypothetical protein
LGEALIPLPAAKIPILDTSHRKRGIGLVVPTLSAPHSGHHTRQGSKRRRADSAAEAVSDSGSEEPFSGSEGGDSEAEVAHHDDEGFASSSVLDELNLDGLADGLLGDGLLGDDFDLHLDFF